jgi:molecular chaperone GrpE
MEENKTQEEINGVEETTTNEVEQLKSQLEESEKKYLLLYADFENYKKRVQKDKEELVTNTKVKMLQSILDMDNDIFYALKSQNVEDSGVKLIAQKLDTFLKSQGVEAIQTETYDEDLHEVISVLEIGETKVIDVASKGYTLNGKPFRYPKIVLGR